MQLEALIRVGERHASWRDEIDPNRNQSEHEFAGDLLKTAFLAAIHGSEGQWRAFLQLCAMEGI